ncbi:MAG: alpha/beta hydrolase [Clostridia bacterium]|nr:alpha/beta hydrolase [Clostridia bacterium]
MDYSLIWKVAEENDRERLSRQSEPDGITKILDIPYVDDNNKYHLFDVYYPENTTSPLPVLIDVHGGGWVYGTKEVNKIYCMKLAQKGYTVFNINYRLMPDCTFAQQMNDVATALGFIYDHLEDYPCDKSRVYLTGDSAGGQLAAFTCAINQSDELLKLFDIEKTSFKANALGLVSPNLYLTPFDFKNVYFRRLLGKDYKNLPYVNYLTMEQLFEKTTFPPMFLVTSKGDYMAVRQTVGAYDVLKAKGVDAELLNWDDETLPHAFSVLEPDKAESIETTQKMLAFLNKY